MKKPISHFKRLLSLEDNDAAPVKVEAMGRKELLAEVIRLNNQVLALQAELTVEHEKTNVVVRILSGIYDGLFHVLSSYMNALRTYKESGNDKPIPAMFMAARVCEIFENVFDNHPVIAHGLGPDKNVLRSMYQIAQRGLNPQTNLGQYLANTPQGSDNGTQENQN
jgi:hypothetical protein